MSQIFFYPFTLALLVCATYIEVFKIFVRFAISRLVFEILAILQNGAIFKWPISPKLSEIGQNGQKFCSAGVLRHPDNANWLGSGKIRIDLLFMKKNTGCLRFFFYLSL